MKRRNFLGALSGGLISRTAAGHRRDRGSRPNIVLIMADDMGFSDIGCYGSEIDTPNVDRLAHRGIRFTRFYNAARCCPTRASLMSGLYSHQVGIGHMMDDLGRPGYRGDLSRNCVTIAEVLRTAGYRTAMSGKWHLTPASEDTRYNWPLQRGFERFFGTLWGGGNYYNPAWLVRNNDVIQPHGPHFYYTDAITDHAVEAIDEYGRGKAPFFSYVAYTAPHWPLHAPKDLVAKYASRYSSGWDQLRMERYQRMIRSAIIKKTWSLSPRDPRVPSWKQTEYRDWEARRMAVYAAQIDRMDQGIGRILAKIREVGSESDTLVLFLSDNGGSSEVLTAKIRQPAAHRTRDGRPIHVGNDHDVMPGPDDTYQSYGVGWANASNTPFQLYKSWVHEGGISTPLIAYWPDVIRPDTLTDEMGHVIDIMATCVELAGVDYPQRHAGSPIPPLEGKSLLPALEGRHGKVHNTLFWEHEGHRAVREAKWKLVSRHPEHWELYDMEADRTEMNDLAARHPDKVLEMTRLYDQWAERCNVVPWAELHKTKLDHQ